MVSLQRLMYRRGYIICDGSSHEAGTYLNQSHLAEFWECRAIGRCSVFMHVDCKSGLSKSITQTEQVLIIGHAIDPIYGEFHEHKISKRLRKALARSRKDFFEMIDDLTGAFVILARDKEGYMLMSDATSVKPIFYQLSSNAPPIFSSHSQIIAKIRQLPVSERVKTIMKSPEYAGDPSLYVPGILSYYENVYALTGNTMFNISKGRIERFWPREPVEPVSSSEQKIEQCSKILRTTAQLLLQKSPLSVALTAGYDTRVTAAALGQLPEPSSYYTFYTPERYLGDRDIAKKIALTLESRHDSYDMTDIVQDKIVCKAVNSSFYSPIWSRLAALIFEKVGNERIAVKSTVSEVGRCFYKYRPFSAVSPEALSKAFTTRPIQNCRSLHDVMSEFIDTTFFHDDRFYGISFYDLFYWEHRNAKWQNAICSEMEVGAEVFIPFNNRRLLSHMLACPEEERMKAYLHVLLIQHMAPELSQIELDTMQN